MSGLRVLLTNHTLADRGGSDLYVRDVSRALLARGHRPIVYSQVLGTVCEDLRLATVPVVDDLDRIAEPPDLIHGQHHLETMTALLHFPRVPAIFVCHGWVPWEEAPPLFPRILRYVAVDEVCRDRLVLQHGIPPEATEVLLNFVDLDRFQPRGPLPSRPQRALLFCNEDGPHVTAVREGCAAAGIVLDVVGRAFGNATASPEALLPHYDLVFAKARAALEALAVGCAVVLVSAVGLGPMVNVEDLERLRSLNLGIRTLGQPLTVAGVRERVERYDALDAAAVSRRIRSSAGRDEAVDRLIGIYHDALARWPMAAVSADDESRAAARYLWSIALAFKWTTLERANLHKRIEDAEAQLRANV
jgi:glycosyltransferase involved in cell wall biosynthesis